jgi:uncharacterized protein DUF3617
LLPDVQPAIGACIGAASEKSQAMKTFPIAVAASILVAVGLCGPAHAVPRGLPHGLLNGVHATATAPRLLPVRYRRHRHHYRRHDERSATATDADGRVVDGSATGSASDDSTIKSGQWEFAAQLEADALAAPGSPAVPGAASFGGGATKSNYAICVAPDKAVPSAFVAGCRLDAVHRDGGRITWSMTCTNPQNAVRSDGVAQYHGDTMTATMVSHLPSDKTGDKVKGGKTIDVAQYITGRYLGPCPNTTTAAATPAGAAATAAAPIAATPPAPSSANATGAAAATAAVPPAPPSNNATSPAAPPGAVPPPPAAPTEAATSAATSPAAQTEASEPRFREEHLAQRRHYHRYRRRYAYRHRYRGYYGGGFYGNGTYRGLGPNPYSANGD